MAGIHIKPSRRGTLHKALGVPVNQMIPESMLRSKLKTAKKGSALKKKLVFAENARHFKH